MVFEAVFGLIPTQIGLSVMRVMFDFGGAFADIKGGLSSFCLDAMETSNITSLPSTYELFLSSLLRALVCL